MKFVIKSEILQPIRCRYGEIFSTQIKHSIVGRIWRMPRSIMIWKTIQDNLLAVCALLFESNIMICPYDCRIFVVQNLTSILWKGYANLKIEVLSLSNPMDHQYFSILLVAKNRSAFCEIFDYWYMLYQCYRQDKQKYLRCIKMTNI